MEFFLDLAGFPSSKGTPSFWRSWNFLFLRFSLSLSIYIYISKSELRALLSYLTGKLNTRKMGDSSREAPFYRYWNFPSVSSLSLSPPPSSPSSATNCEMKFYIKLRLLSLSPPFLSSLVETAPPSSSRTLLCIYVPIDRYVDVCIYIDTVAPLVKI